MESTGLELKKEAEHAVSYNMSADEMKAYAFYKLRLTKAKQERDKNREEFDDMTYEDDYLMNKRAVNTYLRPKVNDAEVRVNTPTTEKKVEIVWNELLNMNLQPEILAFDDEDNEINDVGVHFADIIKRTNEIEHDEDKYVDGILELISQRSVFVEELWLDHTIYDNRNGKKKKTRTQRCDKRFLSGLQIFLGDVNIPAWRFNDQPFIVKYERMSYWEANKIYGGWDKFKHVRPGMFTDGSTGDSYLYRMGSLRSEEVELIHYMSYQDDEYQLIINGIMMLDPGTSYKEIFGDLDGYHIKMVVLKPMALDFAYGKSLVSSAKTLQALDNETLRNLIRKFRQGIEPPMGTRSGKVFSRDIWNPGSITQGLSDKDFFKLDTSNAGVTNSEMAIFKMISDMTTEFVGQSKVQGTPGKRTTATEVLQAQKEAVKLLGMSVLAVMRLKRESTFLRIYNILNNFSEPIKKRKNDQTGKIEDVYQKFTVNDAQIEGEKTGKKMIQFLDRDLTDDELAQVYQYEEEESKKSSPVRFVGVNIKKLINFKLNWFVTVINKERDSSELAKAMFQDKIAQAGQIAQMTMRQLNGDKVIESWERVWGVKDFFQKPAPAPMGGGMPSGQPGEKPGSSPLAEGTASAVSAAHQKPSINAMATAMPA